MIVKITNILNTEDKSRLRSTYRKQAKSVLAIVLSVSLLTGCVDTKVQKKAKVTARQTITTNEVVSDELSDDQFVNSNFIYEIEYMDPDDEKEADKENLLLQKKHDESVVDKIRFGKLALLSSRGEYVEILGVTDDELICFDEEDKHFETAALYCIPLSYKDGKEKVQYEKKEVVWKGDSEKLEGIAFVACVGDNIVCENYDNSGIVEYNRRTHEVITLKKGKKEAYSSYSDNVNSDYRTGDYILCSRYINHQEKGIYCHKVGTKSIELVTENNMEGTIIATGNGKFYYTGLLAGDKSSQYDVWLYDCEQNQNKKLVSREQIEALLPQKPTVGCDLIRELKVVEGKLYIEVRYDGNTYVLSCTNDSGKPKLENEIEELVHHKEYKLSKAIINGNDKYTYCNDRNLYINRGTGMLDERRLDGTYVRTIQTRGGSLLFVNNEELILQYPEMRGSRCFYEIYSVPIVQMDGNDYPDINQKKKVTEIEYEENLYHEHLYADSDVLAFISNCHSFYVFDRKRGKYIKLKNDPPANHYFDNSNIFDSCMEKCFVFNTKPFGEKDDKYGFSYYKAGGEKIIRIESDYYTTNYICDSQRNQIIYGRMDAKKEKREMEFCSYDMKEGKKKLLFTENDLNNVSKESGIRDADWAYLNWKISGDCLYLASDVVVSYDLKEKKLHFEKELTENMKEEKDESVSFSGIMERKVFIRKVKLDEDGEELEETEKIYCYDLDTKTGKMLTEKDPEYLYFLLL